MGLKTRYQDFYPYFINLPTSKDNTIASSIRKDYELWSDLELGLADCLSRCSEEEIQTFFDDKYALETALSNYLSEEERRISISDSEKLTREFIDMTTNFFKEFTEEEQDAFNLFRGKTGPINYTFVTFNYTSLLDTIIEASMKTVPFASHTAGGARHPDTIGMPLHIHGTLKEDLILAVDSVEQIKNEGLRNIPDVSNYFVKANLNQALGQKRMKKFQAIIKNSRYICLFGLSIGDTDQTWWKTIASWLSSNADNRLVIYKRSDRQVPVSGAQKLRIQDRNRKFFGDQSCCDESLYEKIKSQIIVINNSSIFTFKNISITSKSVEPVGAVT